MLIISFFSETKFLTVYLPRAKLKPPKVGQTYQTFLTRVFIAFPN